MELFEGSIVPAFEKPQRAELIRQRINEVHLGPIVNASEFPLRFATAVHDLRMVAFIENAYTEWEQLGRTGGAIPYSFLARGCCCNAVPVSLDGRLAYYTFDVATPVTRTSWQAVKGSVDTALTAAKLLHDGERAAFALCRPPGHHAGTDYYGGYCFLNNAAIAVNAIVEEGSQRVAVLDIDYHHGNGTQEIFYRRDDVLFVSIHADPTHEFPFFSGHADEAGASDGEGFNLNFPLPAGTGWKVWSEALGNALSRIAAYGPDVLVVSLGVDTYHGDPISHFLLGQEDFIRLGKRIASLQRPTLFVMEGGYAVDELGINVVNVLTGYEGA